MKRAAVPGGGHTARPGRRPTRGRSYAVLFLLFAAAIVPTHLWLVRLPYFWDEAGQFIPAALDLLHDGAWVPRSTAPNIHPPALSAWLVAVWRVAGFHPASTRLAMLALASCAALAAFLLAIELTREAKGAPAFLAAGLLCVSPVFFAQSVLAQLDMPATLFTALALTLFLQDRIRGSAAACVALVLFRETGLIVPLVFGVWLARERRWRDAAWFAAPAAALGVWVVLLARHTGYWAGSPEFARYNLLDPLRPARLPVTLARRLYFLLAANFHWIGTAAMVWAWRRTRIFRGRSWQVAGLIVAAHVLLFTVAGGAVLNRYLLPALPIVFAGMAGAISLLPKAWKIGAACCLTGGLAVSNFVNPPYAFPYEENLAFADFLKLHAEAAEYLARWYPDAVVHTAWPMTDELARPELGFTPRAMRVSRLPDLSPRTLESLDGRGVHVLAVFSRSRHPAWNAMRFGPALRFWERFYDFVPDATRDEARALSPFQIAASFERHGQWVEIYASPLAPSRPAGSRRFASTIPAPEGSIVQTSSRRPAPRRSGAGAAGGPAGGVVAVRAN